MGTFAISPSLEHDFGEMFCRQPWIYISALFEHSEYINELLQQSKSICDARPLSWMEGYQGEDHGP